MESRTLSNLEEFTTSNDFSLQYNFIMIYNSMNNFLDIFCEKTDCLREMQKNMMCRSRAFYIFKQIIIAIIGVDTVSIDAYDCRRLVNIDRV